MLSRHHSVVIGLSVASVVFGLSRVFADEAELEAKIQSALRQANPDYEGGGTFRFRDGKLIAINLMRCKGLIDLSPLRRFPIESVTSVTLYNSTNVADISPLRACQLRSLNIERCAKITDLSPLTGMPLTWFRMYACGGIIDLSPLKGMPLKHLDIGLNSQVSDLSPLQGMPLEDLRIDNCPKIKDISVLRKMPLKFLSVFGNKGIRDYSPLHTLKLETLYFTPALLESEDLQQLRKMKSLKKLATSWKDYRKEHKPEDFWKRFDSGDFDKTK